MQESFLPYMDLDCVPVHKHAKINNLGQYPAVLPSQLVSNPYILLKSQEEGNYGNAILYNYKVVLSRSKLTN